MKLKEIPPHLYHTLRLRTIPVKRFHERDVSSEIPVVVSLTTIASRIKVVHITIRSILTQELLPKKIVLWLHERFRSKLPRSLKKLESDYFEVRFTPNDFSHLKLIHTLEEYPKNHIVTIDDDMIYPPNFLRLLYESHQKYPKDIISNHVREIRFDEQGVPLPYVQWPHVKVQPKEAIFLMQLGVFGVWYPPNTLHNEVTNVELLQKLAPKADDLWFKAMAMLHGTTIRLPDERPKNPILILGTQKISLKRTNKTQDFNRTQWQQLTDHFGLTVG